MSLPLANRIALVDPVSSEVRYLPKFEDSDVSGPSGMLVFGDHLLVVGSAGRNIASVDLASGKTTDTLGLPHISEAWSLARGPGDSVLVVGDGLRHGSVVRVSIGREMSPAGVSDAVGPGQNGSALDDDGRLWTVGGEALRRTGTTSVSIVDPRSLEATVLPLPGSPEAIERGDDGFMYATLLSTDELVRLDPRGRVVARLRGVGVGVLGLAIDHGRAAVVSHTEDGRSSVALVDLATLEVRRSIPLGDSCPEAWDPVFVGDRLVVTCAGLPGVAVVRLHPLRVVRSIPLVRGIRHFKGYEQPRSPTVIPPGAFIPSG